MGLHKTSEDELKDVNGGYIHLREANRWDPAGYDWEVINDKNGNVMSGPLNMVEAIKRAEELGMSSDIITNDDLASLQAKNIF